MATVRLMGIAYPRANSGLAGGHGGSVAPAQLAAIRARHPMRDDLEHHRFGALATALGPGALGTRPLLAEADQQHSKELT